LNTKQIGDISEAACIKKFISLGYGVSVTFGDNERYDLLVDDKSSIRRVQVKTGKFNGTSVVFECANMTTKNGESVHKTYTKDEIDTFAIYCEELDNVYEVPVERSNKRSMTLRVDESEIDHPQIDWAENYKI
jgi:hypothetical protein